MADVCRLEGDRGLSNANVWIFFEILKSLYFIGDFWPLPPSYMKIMSRNDEWSDCLLKRFRQYWIQSLFTENTQTFSKFLLFPFS